MEAVLEDHSFHPSHIDSLVTDYGFMIPSLLSTFLNDWEGAIMTRV